ncbi:MAG: hypothetical protein IH857_03580 [Deltaproteobacteria bacterium]|nr:hypothetical protein [Deltaproteobacteria bacterium]
MLGMYHSRFSIIAISLVLLGQHSGVWAGEERDVTIPLIFEQDNRTEIKTSACLKVREKVYGVTGTPWNSFKSEARPGPETLLTETIAAMQKKDSARLKELSHPSLGRDPQKFQEQAFYFFRQFEGLQLGDVWGYYRSGDLLVFLLQLHFGPKPFFVKFSFAREGNGNFGFLPYRSRSLTSEFLVDWFESEWGPQKTQSPVYCTPSLLERMTHKVLLDKHLDSRLGHYDSHPLDPPAELLLIGRNFTDKEIKDQPYAALRDKFSALKDALKAGRMDEYFDGFTEHGRKKVKTWFLGAPEEERRGYIERILSLEPFYVFNAEPVFIVYARTRSSAIRVLYFVPDKKGQFRWANAYYLTIFDSIFRKSTKAAGEEKPFDSWKIAKGSRNSRVKK